MLKPVRKHDPFVSTPPPTTKPKTDPKDLGVEREIRFAVVMYGGVSLAIYINGVTQELLNMVRATAPKSAYPNSPDADNALLDADDFELTGSAGVSRKLGQFLYGEREQLKWEERPVDADVPEGKKIKV